MPERVDKTPRWRLVKPLPPLMMPKRALIESSEANISKQVIKNTKIIPQNSINENKDSYKILMLIRELALAQEREEVLNASASIEKDANLKMKLEISRIKQELDESRRKEESLTHQLRESSKIVSYYEQEISVLRVKKPIEKDKTSIGVGTDIIAQVETISVKSDDRNKVDLAHFLKLCHENEMSISVAIDQSEKLDTVSLCSDSQISLSDQKIQVVKQSHPVGLKSGCTQTQSPKKVDNIGVQTDDYSTCSESIAEYKAIENFKAKIEATPDYLKFIMNAYADNELPIAPIKPQISAKRESSFETSKDFIKFTHKNPCFKTSPKNSICTCSKKSDSLKSSNELLHSNTGMFLLQDETSMLVPLQDLLAELEESQRESDTLDIEDESIVGVENQDIDDLKMHDLKYHFAKKVQEPLDPLEFWIILAVCGVLVILGGIFAGNSHFNYTGLTIGLMSLDSTNIQILKASGSERERIYAERIEPIRKSTHILLVTLLLANTIVNETLPVLFHVIHLDGYQAVLISTALIVIFGEIIPQAVCVRYGLAIGAFFAWPVRILMWILYPIVYPTAKLLDWILGHENAVIYKRAELKELVKLHGEGPQGTLNKDEVSIVKAVLDLRDKTADRIMTNIDDVFMLPFSGFLNRETFEKIIQKGHSRVPIYHQSRQNVIGVVLVKSLGIKVQFYETVIIDTNRNVPLSNLQIRRLPRVEKNTQLFDLLHIFRSGGSHMALVVEPVTVDEPMFPHLSATDSPLWVPAKQPDSETRYRILGIITLEDVIEELLGEEIIDETDVYVDMNSKVAVLRDYDSRPSALAPGSHILASEAPDELTPLLLDALDDKTPSGKQMKKDKAMIPAVKLLSDAASRGPSALRPAHILSPIPSESIDGLSKEPKRSRSIDDGLNTPKYETSKE